MEAWSKSYEDILIRGDPSLASKSPEAKARLKALVKEMEIAKGAAKYQECADWIGCIVGCTFIDPKSGYKYEVIEKKMNDTWSRLLFPTLPLIGSLSCWMTFPKSF